MPTDSDNIKVGHDNHQVDDGQEQANKNLAINVIRSKLDNLYSEEPDALKEEQEVRQIIHRSKHQQFMYELTTSNKDLAQIQTEWHRYYLKLSDEEKRQVWNEFYASNTNANTPIKPAESTPTNNNALDMAKHVQQRAVKRRPKTTSASQKAQTTKKSASSSPARYRRMPTTTPKLTWKHHLQSILFGLSMGLIVVIILMFGFFNEVIIAPFIQPSRNDTATPIILSTQTVAPSSTPEVIIPKINVEIPVNYSVNTTNENVIENYLQDGVVHYPTTSIPGQTGNAAFFGHSSNNILNPGKYKFAFVLLHDLVDGDVFYLTYGGKVYAYKVFSTSIVNPNDVSVLNPIPKHSATATLITCDPPGTSINRLVVVGDQISPSPSGDSAPTTATTATTTSNVNQLPGNGPSLWSRYISTLWGKAVTAVFVIGVIYVIWRWYKKEFKSS